MGTAGDMHAAEERGKRAAGEMQAAEEKGRGGQQRRDGRSR
jgi:hypothetical protein